MSETTKDRDQHLNVRIKTSVKRNAWSLEKLEHVENNAYESNIKGARSVLQEGDMM